MTKLHQLDVFGNKLVVVYAIPKDISQGSVHDRYVLDPLMYVLEPFLILDPLMYVLEPFLILEPLMYVLDPSLQGSTLFLPQQRTLSIKRTSPDGVHYRGPGSTVLLLLCVLVGAVMH